MIASIWDFALFNNYIVFLLMMIAIMFVIGAMSKEPIIAWLGGWMTFVYIAVDIGVPLFTNTLYILLVLLTVGMGFQLYEYTTGKGAFG